MKIPELPIEGGSVKETVSGIIDFLKKPPLPSRSPRSTPILFPDDTLPPFWPVLNSEDDSAFTFTLTDGYVIDMTTGVPVLYLPTGLSTSGLRTQISITAALPQISIIVDTDPFKVVTGIRYELEAIDTASIEADGGTVDGEYHYKLAVFHAAVSQYPAYLEMFLAGSHVFYNLGPPPPAAHPWEVTANGDDTVTVAAGRILTMKNEQGLGVSDPPTWVRLQQIAKFTGGDVEGIDANGYIYAYLPATISADHMFTRDDTTGLEIWRNIPSGSLNVAFSTTLPENSGGSTHEFCFVIAEVAYSGGVVTVTEQILTHNPTMWHIDLPPEP